MRGYYLLTSIDEYDYGAVTCFNDDLMLVLMYEYLVSNPKGSMIMALVIVLVNGCLMASKIVQMIEFLIVQIMSQYFDVAMIH